MNEDVKLCFASQPMTNSSQRNMNKSMERGLTLNTSEIRWLSRWKMLQFFVTTWNDLLQQTIYINSREKYTMAIGLTAFMGSFKNDYSGMFAATCLSFLPCLLVYLVGQRYFVEGIVMTGMKN